MRMLAAVAALAAFAVVPACSSEAATSIAGTYKVEAVVDGLPEEAKVMVGAMTWGDCNITADGKWDASMEAMGQKSTVKGTYTVEGNKITMVDTHSDGQENEDPQPAEGTIDGDVITLEMPATEGMPGITLKMTKK